MIIPDESALLRNPLAPVGGDECLRPWQKVAHSQWHRGGFQNSALRWRRVKMFIPVRFFSFLHPDPHGGHQRLRATRPQPPDWKWMEPGNVRRTTARLFRAGRKRPKGEGGARFDVAGRIPSPWSPLQPSSTPAKAPFRQRNPEDCRHAPVRLPVRVRSAFRPHFHPLTETSSPHAGFPASFPALPLSGRIGAASPGAAGSGHQPWTYTSLGACSPSLRPGGIRVSGWSSHQARPLHPGIGSGLGALRQTGGRGRLRSPRVDFGTTAPPVPSGLHGLRQGQDWILVPDRRRDRSRRDGSHRKTGPPAPDLGQLG